jgi:hypothetical protein
MNWLLWKDYRHNRLIVFTTVALLLAPYLIVVIVMCIASWIRATTHDIQELHRIPHWNEAIAVAAIYSLAISQFSLALIGGNAISGERVDRSSHFLYSLPITRRKLFASKLLFALAITAVVWLVNIAVLLFLIGLRPKLEEGIVESAFTGAAYVATTGLTFFCVAWFLSSFAASPAFDVCGGVIAPFLVFSGLTVVDQAFDLHLQHEVIAHCYLIACLALAAVCFATGTWYYLRRIEP